MLRLTQEQLINSLHKQENFKFKTFELHHEGDYHPSDADWNYKDVPHLKHVHHLVDGFPTYISDEYVSAIFVQKMPGGIKIPLSVMNYQSGHHRQTYHTTLFWFILIIETSYKLLEEKDRTRVTTRYAIGARGLMKLVLVLIFHLMKYSIKRNYKDLMSGDIPMRERRGQLRKWGYSFNGDNKSYSFFNTTKILEKNVVPPNSVREKHVQYDLHQIIKETEHKNNVLMGKADAFGLRIHRLGDDLMFYPRMCPHEGSCLDDSPLTHKKIMCPWHGRLFNPIVTLNLNNPEVDCSTEFVNIKIQNYLVNVTFKGI